MMVRMGCTEGHWWRMMAMWLVRTIGTCMRSTKRARRALRCSVQAPPGKKGMRDAVCVP
jgi:hypothetical protein